MFEINLKEHSLVHHRVGKAGEDYYHFFMFDYQNEYHMFFVKNSGNEKDKNTQKIVAFKKPINIRQELDRGFMMFINEKNIPLHVVFDKSFYDTTLEYQFKYLTENPFLDFQIIEESTK